MFIYKQVCYGELKQISMKGQEKPFNILTKLNSRILSYLFKF
jgi:hypothetical protein